MQGKTSRWDCVIVADWSGLVRCVWRGCGGVRFGKRDPPQMESRRAVRKLNGWVW